MEAGLTALNEQQQTVLAVVRGSICCLATHHDMSSHCAMCCYPEHVFLGHHRILRKI